MEIETDKTEQQAAQLQSVQGLAEMPPPSLEDIGSNLSVKTYTHSSQLPTEKLVTQRYFRALFDAYEATPGFAPYLFTVVNEDGTCYGSLFAVTQRCLKWFPPFLFHKGFVYSEGDYADVSETVKKDIFVLLLAEATRTLLRRSLMIEFKHIRNGRFGYKQFRDQHYFPVHWLEVHNSLHSRTPEERVFEREYKRIKKSEQLGTTLSKAATPDEVADCVRLLRHYYASKPRRYCPPLVFFQQLLKSGAGHLVQVRNGGRTVGVAFVLVVDGDAYLLYSAGLRKTFPQFAPGIMAVWGALKLAEQLACAHLRFTDAGLPFRTNPYRDFILSFGGTQQSTRRWFRFRWTWLNKILTKIYV